ncbi:MAG: dTDP-4-dehydrorhamnose reductase [Anaerolineales bacterium]
MKILLLGNTGQLGWELQRTLAPLGPLTALDYPEIDLNDGEAARALVRDLRPQVMVNATAYTAVDRAEGERETAFALNTETPRILAEEAERLGAALLHYSTDYVFDGRKGAPYTEDDPTAPLNVYGESKLAGEQAIQQVGGAHLIFRTAWVYSLRRPSFVTKVLSWAQKNPVLRIVDDQVSNPTWARALAEISAQVLAQAAASGAPLAWLQARTGVYHLAGGGFASRYAWGREIIRLGVRENPPQVVAAKSADFPTPAQRPLFSVLDCSKFEAAFGLRLPPWQQALALAMDSGK